MINLRYHIVSLTAVFLAIGIGLTLGSTFLDQATVDNLEGQLGSLQSGLDNRDTRIGNLERDLAESTAMSNALDEQGAGLLAGRLTDVPVVVLTARGADEEAVRASLQSLVVAGADVDGIWWITERFLLDADADVTDLANVLGETSDDPSRLRRMTIEAVAGELRARQLLGVADPAEEPATDPAEDPLAEDPPAEDPLAEDPATDPAQDPAAGDPTTDPALDPVDGDEVPTGPDLIAALFDAGFLEFEVVPGGLDAPSFVDGARILVAGGSPDVPDDVVIEPLLAQMAQASTTPLLAVVGSAGGGDRVLSDAVSVIRQDETLRLLISTVDTLEHFDGWAAMVLAMADLDEGVIGHYGLGEGASRLLPSQRIP